MFDVLGNRNQTETRELTLTPGDIQGPVITYWSPSADEYINVSSVLFNVSLDEDGDTVLYSLDGGVTNYTMSTLDNTYFNATNTSITDGDYTVTVYSNDTIGNPSSEPRNFTIDTSNPLIEYVSSQYDLSYEQFQYNYSGNPSNPLNAFDDNYSTFTVVDSLGGVDILYMNYSVPFEATTAKLEYLADHSLFSGKFECYNSSNEWEIFETSVDNTKTNASIPSECFESGIFQLRFYRDLIPEESGYVNFYEEEVYWNITPITEISYSNLSQNYIITNVFVTEINEANITFLLYNESEQINKSTFTNVVRSINWSNLSDGNYTYNVTIVDLASNKNTTATYWITLDTTNPNGTLISPANETLSN